MSLAKLLRVADRRRLKLEWNFDDALGDATCRIHNWRQSPVGLGYDAASSLSDLLRKLDERYR